MQHRILVVAGVLAFTGAAPAEAQILKKLGRAVTAPTRAAARVATAPARAVVQVARGGNVVRAARGVAAAPLAAQADVVSSVAAVHSEVSAGLTNGARSIAGRPGAAVVGAVLTPNSLAVSKAVTVSTGGAAIVDGSASPVDAIGLPLAVEIDRAERAHMASAMPIPEDVKNALRGLIPDEVLEAARYTVGELEITLPNTVNGAQRLFGGHGTGHAVVVGHVIVFSRAPGASYGWWAHELTHVHQYRTWGTLGFARRYTLDSGGVEAEGEEARARYEVHRASR